MSQFELLRERRFRPFFVTQFLGAFNDNAFKNALVILIAFQSDHAFGMSPDVLINLSAGLFILPFFKGDRSVTPKSVCRSCRFGKITDPEGDHSS